jgi:hypothetical protein
LLNGASIAFERKQDECVLCIPEEVREAWGTVVELF